MKLWGYLHTAWADLDVIVPDLPLAMMGVVPFLSV
jgi:hypothetical protein